MPGDEPLVGAPITTIYKGDKVTQTGAVVPARRRGEKEGGETGGGGGRKTLRQGGREGTKGWSKTQNHKSILIIYYGK